MKLRENLCDEKWGKMLLLILVSLPLCFATVEETRKHRREVQPQRKAFTNNSYALGKQLANKVRLQYT
jgi:hypothetical protein